jgi:hypothetical protein
VGCGYGLHNCVSVWLRHVTCHNHNTPNTFVHRKNTVSAALKMLLNGQCLYADGRCIPQRLSRNELKQEVPLRARVENTKSVNCNPCLYRRNSAPTYIAHKSARQQQKLPALTVILTRYYARHMVM